MRLPDCFYEALPFIFSIAGIATIHYGENLVSKGSGALFIFIAILIWLIPIKQNK
jgi:hypothetical protein